MTVNGPLFVPDGESIATDCIAVTKRKNVRIDAVSALLHQMESIRFVGKILGLSFAAL